MVWLVVMCFLCAALPALLYFRNVVLYRPPPIANATDSRSAVSVLIPARNEEGSIAGCVMSVLASEHVELECIVLDDHSTDATADIVHEIHKKYPRVRLETAPPLPPGWTGKQHACYTLATLAQHEVLVFLDADVRLTPDGIIRLAQFQQTSGAALVSGFPRQETGTSLEKLILPLIHFILLGFLPLSRMRQSSQPSLGAGCGQWFLTTATAYRQVGGHSHLSVRNSFHDGVKLPRAYRACGLMTDLCDVTSLATCRMYHTAGQVWNGLAKNAREGLGSPRLLLFSTAILMLGQVLPWYLVVSQALVWQLDPVVVIARVTVLLSHAVRFDMAKRFQQSKLSAILHPMGIVLFLAIQWYANLRAILGTPVGWKGRPKT